MVCFIYPENPFRLCISILSKINAGCYLLFLSHHSIDTFLHIHGQFLIHEVYVVCVFHCYGYQYCILMADFVGNGVIYYFCTYNKTLIPVILGYVTFSNFSSLKSGSECIIFVNTYNSDRFFCNLVILSH